MNESLIELHQPPFCQCNVIGSPSSVVYNMDCVEGMKQYSDKYFDLAICDPPYGIQVQNNFGIGNRNDKKKDVSIDWDNNTPNDDYFNELKRVSKEQIIWGANYFNCFSGKMGAIIWDKLQPLPDSSQCEIASYSRVRKVFKYTQRWTNFVNTKETEHPTEKPIELYKWLIKNFAECSECGGSGELASLTIDCDVQTCKKCKGNTPKILDTHLGSGPSRIAAYFMGVDFVGFELSKKYCQMQSKRFKDAISQQRLF